jgi:hypothetical protein
MSRTLGKNIQTITQSKVKNIYNNFNNLDDERNIGYSIFIDFLRRAYNA